MCYKPVVLLGAYLYLLTLRVSLLQWWVNTCVWWAELPTRNRVLYLCLCAFFFVPPTFAVIYIAVFTLFWALREKTNKDMSSASFIAGQPVISASAVVCLRLCHLICLSLSKTCLCGPLDQLRSCSEIVCGLGVCEVCICVRLIVNYEFFSHAPTPVKQSVSYAWHVLTSAEPHSCCFRSNRPPILVCSQARKYIRVCLILALICFERDDRWLYLFTFYLRHKQILLV